MGKRGDCLGKKAKSLLKIAAVYLGTVLGAGFASGQELVLFFARFGKRGFIGCLVAGCLFCLLGALVLSKSNKLTEKTHRRYLESVFKPHTAALLAFATGLFLCVGFCIMLSGSGAFFKERFNLPAWVGIIATAFICLFVFTRGVSGLSVVNLILTPIMIVGTLYICLYTIITENTAAWLPHIHPHGLFLPYALFYVGYNLLTATAVLVPTSALADTPKAAAWGGVLGGAALSVMALLCCITLSMHTELWNSALPLLLLSQTAGRLAYYTYSAVLYMAMLTTAVSTGFSVAEWLVAKGFTKKKAAYTVCLTAIPLSFVEFSVLVQRCYVFFGVLGICLISGIFWDWYKTA